MRCPDPECLSDRVDHVVTTPKEVYRQPKEGAVFICRKCAQLSLLQYDGHENYLEEMTALDFAAFPPFVKNFLLLQIVPNVLAQKLCNSVYR